MRNLYLVVGFVFLFFKNNTAQHGNLVFVGHNTANNVPLANTGITVFEGANKIQSINTESSSDFKLTMPLGKNYKIYFENKRTQKMFLEVKMDDIPESKLDYKITYELTVPFFPKDSKTIDSTQFRNAFHKIKFDGKKNMVDDSVYMKQFISKVYIKIKEEEEVAVKPPTTVKWTNLAGKFTYTNKEKTPVINKKVYLLNNKGEVIKTTNTNKFGTFIFTGVNLNEAGKVEVDFKKEFSSEQVSIDLSNSKDELICNTNVISNKADCQNTPQVNIIEKLIDPRFTYKISAKLIADTKNEKTFFANKTVYLLNERNTIVKRAKTNIMGSFVFTEIKPGVQYLIGVDKNEVNSDSKISLYSNKDNYLAPVDSVLPGRFVRRFRAENNIFFNEILIDEAQLKMDIRGKLYGDNVNNPLGDIQIMLLNDKMETIDTTTTDNFGNFMFKYLPYKADYNFSFSDKYQMLDAISNILVYNSDDEIIKIVSGIKGKRFKYKLLAADQNKLVEIYAEDPWLELLSGKKMKKGQTETIIENIFFEKDKSDLLPDAQTTLIKVAMVLKASTKLKLELNAHTDCNGDDKYNQTLSEQRAKAASDYIIARGVEAERVIGKGFGESKILNHCKNGVFCPDDEHHENRRIEFKMVQN